MLQSKSPLSAHTRHSATGTRASHCRPGQCLALPNTSPWPQGSFCKARKFFSGIYPCTSQEVRLLILNSTDLHAGGMEDVPWHSGMLAAGTSHHSDGQASPVVSFFLTGTLHNCGRIPWLDAGCPPKPLHRSPPQLGRGEKI